MLETKFMLYCTYFSTVFHVVCLYNNIYHTQAIPAILSGEHTICHAETGSGKTLCYLLPLLHNLLVEQEQGHSDPNKGGGAGFNSNKVQSLVFIPTPELGQQIKQMFEHIRPVE